MVSYRPVAAVVRALEVLTTINRLGGQATIREVAEITELDKATVHRMFETLESVGFLARCEGDKNFRVTGMSLRLSSGYKHHKTIGRIVSPRLAEFREQIGWASDVGVFDYDAMILTESSRGGVLLSFDNINQFRPPMFATSIGMAYMAFLPDDERSAMIERFASNPASWNDLARTPDKAEEEFQKIREQGYATMHAHYSRENYKDQLSAIGAPIMREGKVYAGINILFLKNVVTAEKIAEAHLDLLQKTARAMAEDIYQQWEQ